MQERENVLRIFQEAKEAVERNDSATLKNLSNQTNNTAALTSDPDNIAAAVIVYSLSKIIENGDRMKLPGWGKFYTTYVGTIENVIGALKRKDDDEYRSNIMALRKAMAKLSGRMKDYINDVFRKAMINKASKIYEHGISMERTADLLGITLYELASYSGQKETTDVPQIETLGVKQRIKLAMDFFR